MPRKSTTENIRAKVAAVRPVELCVQRTVDKTGFQNLALCLLLSNGDLLLYSFDDIGAVTSFSIRAYLHDWQ